MFIIKCDKLNSSSLRRDWHSPLPLQFYNKKAKLCKKFILKLYSFLKKSFQYLLLKVKQVKAKRPFFIGKKNKHLILLLDQFKLLYCVSLLSNYSVIGLMFFEKPLPCQNENWGYNFFQVLPLYFFPSPEFPVLSRIPTVFTTR